MNSQYWTKARRQAMNDLVDVTYKVIQTAIMAAGNQIIFAIYDT